MLEQYSTEAIPPLQRVKRWCEFGRRTLPELAVRPCDPKAFNARFLRASVGDLDVTQMHTTPAFAEGQGVARGSQIRARDGWMLITLQKSGKSRILQAGRDAVCLPGDVIIRDLSRHWEIDACSGTSCISIRVSASSLAECLGDLDRIVAVPLRAGNARTDLLASVIESFRNLAFERRELSGPADARQLIFAATAIAYEDSTSASAASGEHPDHIFKFIDERLCDPTLTITGLAAALNMSVRSLQRLFFQSGTTPRAYIVSRRLKHAAERLRDLPRGASMNITDVALASGFNDPGYFSRAFRQQLGMAPSEFLRRQRSSA